EPPRYAPCPVLPTIGSPYFVCRSPAMVDRLAEVVLLLKPAARFSKQVVGAGPWRVSRSDAGEPFYCAVIEGGCRLALEGRDTVVRPASRGFRPGPRRLRG